ncbi:MAG: DEAD/DEAH box helicase [Clostridia bacterium]|nr:DEAD/DEAH box helicase [Clostridia bacterium]
MMIWIIDYDLERNAAVIISDSQDSILWQSFLRTMSSYSTSIQQHGDRAYIPLRTFLSLRKNIAQFLKNHHDEIKASLSAEIQGKLTDINLKSYNTAIRCHSTSDKNVDDRLKTAGFVRQLTPNQKRNVGKLANLPAGASFSVPGAGKTTEALAYFFYNASDDDKLLVVAPKNAFCAWEEQIQDCTNNQELQFVRLRGGYTMIDKALRDQPRFMLITYQQYARVTDLIKRYLEQFSVFMFLDESHRIKSGLHGVTPEAILSSCTLPARKMILSGTPMPQSVADLIPQFTFLYPDTVANTETVVSLITPIYVRTTKAELGLPEVTRKTISLDMSPLQREIYKSLKSEIRRQLIPMLSDASKFSLRELGKRIMKVVQFVSNPSLLASDLDYVFDERIGDLLAKTDGPKIEYACKRAMELASQGKKVIIWSQFVKNVEIISDRLKYLGSDYIHGGVDAGNEEESDTREWKIKQFHENPNKMVLVANPAAASEGISLHKVCHNAIYVDRSFNAAHYLQSEDRIHRLGLSKDQNTEVEILECVASIDQVIDSRLRRKIDLMSQSLNDPSLNVDTIHYDSEIDVDEILSPDDVEAIKSYFGDDSI